jgi:putative transcriptional regulator|tara:strand:- start:381 stop:1028 length:648 start_codon:yes stop_codon:yes gene_type:complete
MNEMKTINHHLTDQLLMGYSSGNLPEAFNLVVATHLSMCDECRAALDAYDAVGGSLLDTDETSEMDSSSLAATMKLIAAKPAVKKSTPKSSLPGPLANYIGGDLESVKWRPVGMGVRQAILKTSKKASARLLYIPAGSAIPDHGHKGTELTLVIKGAFSDKTARFSAGDVEVANEDIEHTPVAEIGEDCICLSATDAPLRFNSLVPRIVQPFLNI